MSVGIVHVEATYDTLHSFKVLICQRKASLPVIYHTYEYIAHGSLYFRLCRTSYTVQVHQRQQPSSTISLG